MVDTSFRLLPGVKRAMRRFKRKHPFRLRGDEFLSAVDALFADLSRAYRMPKPNLAHVGPWEGDSGGSTYGEHGQHYVALRGHESVLTALHEFTHARGYGEHGAVWWSVNVFRLTFPRSFSRLRVTPGSHFLTRAPSPVPGGNGGYDPAELDAILAMLTGAGGPTLVRPRAPRPRVEENGDGTVTIDGSLEPQKGA